MHNAKFNADAIADFATDFDNLACFEIEIFEDTGELPCGCVPAKDENCDNCFAGADEDAADAAYREFRAAGDCGPRR